MAGAPHSASTFARSCSDVCRIEAMFKKKKLMKERDDSRRLRCVLLRRLHPTCSTRRAFLREWKCGAGLDGYDDRLTRDRRRVRFSGPVSTVDVLFSFFGLFLFLLFLFCFVLCFVCFVLFCCALFLLLVGNCR